MNTNPPILKAKGLHKTFDHPARVTILDGVDLEVLRGEAIAITGRSGEGKSTFLHILGTLDDPSQGALEIAGQQLNRFNIGSIRNKHLGFVFQSFHLLEDYSVLENVLMPAKIARASTKVNSQAYNHACSLLEQVGLKDRIHFYAKQLSGGEKQRVAIARALCNNPDIILADEPSGNLDKLTAAGIHQILMDLVKIQGKSLIIVTHDPELAALCDKRYVLEAGKLLDQNI